ncbi:GntR family transcriptional regulator [Acidimangrovimonas sediminis]|uniref:GntR family transcriptional regulator n=1 Tax=Acidimangrovimonas sediminis TaxID=2056283 RepID=UPI000C80FA1B|nr:GntR family transcriptional regulator [Acidimangrovimonas sediminis]
MIPLFSPEGFDDSGHGPLYRQLSRRIGEGIANGLLKPGETLPPERDMATMTGLSRVTVRKAVQALVESGQLVQRRGSGTYVAPKVERLEQALSLLTSFSEDMRRRGKASHSVWLDRSLHSATPEEVMVLGLAAHDRVARLARVRMADGVPLAIERASLPARLLPDPAAVETSLYDDLDARGLRPVRAVQRLSAVNIGAADAALLELTPGTACLRIERIAYLASGATAEYTLSLYRGDAYDFAAELRLAGDDTGETP